MISFAPALSVAAKSVQPEAAPDPPPLRVSGPYTHANLSVFLLHGDDAVDTEFITLEEGLRDGTVTVKEQEVAQVGQLIIENRSQRTLFLQEGDRLQGGKQDRTIRNTLAIRPKSGPTPLPSFCIEQSRWSQGASGDLFSATPVEAIAPKSVRLAAKAERDQGRVWDEVAQLKVRAVDARVAESQTSSLNEAMDSEALDAETRPYEAALAGTVAQQPDAVGVVFAVNGRIEEANVYPNRSLLGKVYPKLIKSYAVHAALHPPDGDATDAPSVTVSDVEAYMAEPYQTHVRTDEVDEFNRTLQRSREDSLYFESSLDGQVIHRQMMRVESPDAAPDRED
ncbi:MAG: DUF6569 family protein [Planctomycetota bacterium]